MTSIETINGWRVVRSDSQFVELSRNWRPSIMGGGYSPVWMMVPADCVESAMRQFETDEPTFVEGESNGPHAHGEPDDANDAGV